MASLTLLVEEAVEFLHDGRLHNLAEEDVLLSQLLGCEVLPAARGPLVVVEEVDEGGVGRLGEEFLIDIREEPGAGRGRPSERPARRAETPPELPGAGAGMRGLGSEAEWGLHTLLGTMHEVPLFFHFISWKVSSILSPANPRNPPKWIPTGPQMALSVSGDPFFPSPFGPACLEEKRAEAPKRARLGERLQEEA